MQVQWHFAWSLDFMLLQDFSYRNDGNVCNAEV